MAIASPPLLAESLHDARAERSIALRRKRYDLTDAQRSEMLDLAMDALRNPEATVKDRNYTIRTLALLDRMDRDRDRDDQDKNTASDNQTLALIRSALATPEGRAALQIKTQQAYAAIEQQTSEKPASHVLTDNGNHPSQGG